MLFSFVPLLMLMDGQISRLEGVILLIVYGWLVKKMMVKQNQEDGNGKTKIKLLISALFWLGLLILSSQVVVTEAKELAKIFELSPFLVGIFLVSGGTTLPELAFNIKSAQKGEVAMSLGNVVGSCVTNSCLALGIAVIIRPIVVVDDGQLVLAAHQYGLMVLVLATFIISKHRLEKWEGATLMALYGYYFFLQISRL